MEGITDPVFRDLVLSRHSAETLGGAFTEFLRVVDHPASHATIRRHLGEMRYPIPVGLQLMGGNPASLAETARRAVELGVPLIDLNFGCPARGARKGCAGAALLDDLQLLEAVVRACSEASGRVPVTAKVRAGGEDADSVEEIAQAVEAGGARLLTIHCRTRREAYCEELRWDRIARAVAAVTIPVCGNGGISTHGELQNMREETGCAYVMVGRAALGDPWIFSGQEVATADAATFLLDYAAALEKLGASPRGISGRLKQLIRRWTAAELTRGHREQLLGTQDPAQLLSWLADRARAINRS